VERTWFDEARFGMFIHWDHASQRGLEVSWPLVGGAFTLPRCQSVTPDEYRALASTFSPDAWDPADLAARANAAAMRYMVFTTRHHSGFSMNVSPRGACSSWLARTRPSPRAGSRCAEWSGYACSAPIQGRRSVDRVDPAPDIAAS
jgi:hypothetical protein